MAELRENPAAAQAQAAEGCTAATSERAQLRLVSTGQTPRFAIAHCTGKARYKIFVNRSYAPERLGPSRPSKSLRIENTRRETNSLEM